MTEYSMKAGLGASAALAFLEALRLNALIQNTKNGQNSVSINNIRIM